ncbi:MAG: peptidoglycan bridge formation glycyltransferase FemA/FemB family protein [Syntrophomonadaceae bacterium]|nr:peptidoglycan bridge formation glycyltransferase FemA/FemB family protein [Syntrophomonadaceae bacterium]
MQLRYREITPGEREEYNAFVSRAPKGHVLQSYEWGEVKATTGWEPIRLVVEEGDSIVAAISILKRWLPGTGYSIFYAPRGPVGDLADQRSMDILFKAVREVALKHQAIFLKLDPDVPVEEDSFRQYLLRRGFHPASSGEGFEGVQPRFVFRMDITPPLEELFENLAAKTRYNLRLAERRGVRLKEPVTRADLPEFYQVLRETAQRDRFLIRSYSYFETIWKFLVERGMGRLFLAEYQGQIIAGTLALIFGKQAWYLYGASSNQHRNVMPNYLLQWAMITWAKERGCSVYDFRGVPGRVGDDHPLYGLYRFKKGFGGVYTEFIGEYDLVFKPALYWIWNWAEPLYYKAVRSLIDLKKRLKGQKLQPTPAEREI